MSVIVTWPLLGAVAIHNDAYVIANTQNGRTGNGVCVEAQSSTPPAVSNYKCYAPFTSGVCCMCVWLGLD